MQLTVIKKRKTAYLEHLIAKYYNFYKNDIYENKAIFLNGFSFNNNCCYLSYDL